MLKEALSLHQKGQLSEASSLYRKILAENPRHAEALHLLGLAELQLGNASAAIDLIDRAIKINPKDALAYSNRGNALQSQMRFDDALASYDRALAIKPDFADAYYNRGLVLQELGRLDDALASYDRALAVKPHFTGALSNRGIVLQSLNRPTEAIDSYDRALAIDPNCAEAHYNRGSAFQDLHRLDEALASYDRALAIKPDSAFLFGQRLLCKMEICDWRGLTADFLQLAEKIRAGKRASQPFPVLATPLSSALQRICAETYARQKYAVRSALPSPKLPYDHDRIRLGYFSADFHNHATAYLMAELFERHDRGQFELNAFSFGPVKRDVMRGRLEKSFDRLIEVGGLSDKDVALLARSLEIDIAVDLKGFTTGNRTGIFALRPAPVQVSYLGYPGTMGADYIDYLIADPTLVPEDEQAHYVEKIVYLPDTYQVNDSRRPIADRRFTRAECGLPEADLVFCCFNNTYKITPELFDIWMRLLNRVEHSALWLFANSTTAVENLRVEARARGIDPERLVFATLMELPEHLARHRLADLFLDTLPYNAHTTASDSLWSGVPVLTCLGKTFPGRVSASLLNAIGLPELITQNLAEYETLAVQLATNPQRLLALKQKLAANRSTHPLFDAARFTRHLESAYVSMWKRRQAGLAPVNIHIRATGGSPLLAKTREQKTPG